MTSTLTGLILTTVLATVMLGVPAARAVATPPGQVLNASELDARFRLLHELKTEEARGQFATWQKSHPQDPLGSASEAASYLFEEFYRQRILTSEFFLDDKRSIFPSSSLVGRTFLTEPTSFEMFATFI